MKGGNKSGFEGSEAKEEKRTADSCTLNELRHPDGNDLLSAHRIIDERASSAYWRDTATEDSEFYGLLDQIVFGLG